MRIPERSPERIQQTIDLLKEVWEKNPDLRLGQLVIASGQLGQYKTAEHKRSDTFDLEDNVLIVGLTVLNSVVD